MKIELKLRMELKDTKKPLDFISIITQEIYELFGRDNITSVFPTVTLLPDDEKINNSMEDSKIMENLSTIRKREKLNEVHALDEKGAGGAYHHYTIVDREIDPEYGGQKEYACIKFQNGARKEVDSIHGVLDTDLLEICRHRLQCFQAGQFATRENAIALTHIEEALLWLNKRVEDRIERNVLGTMQK